MMNLKLKRAATEDQYTAYKFFERVILHTFMENGITEDVYSWKEELAYKKTCLMEDYESKGADRCYFFAWYGDGIIGSVEIGPANKDILKGTVNELAGMMEIGTVFVDPEHQRQGISLKLFEKAIEELKARGYKSYCFDSGYPLAQKIWTGRFGAPTYHLKDYWGDGADHMVWVQEIQ